MKPTIFYSELFCGAGGMSLGAKWAAQELGFDLRHVFAVDNNAAATDTYQRNIAPLDNGSKIRAVPMRFHDTGIEYTQGANNGVLFADIRNARFRGLFDGAIGVKILAFGFPCNDFSVINKQGRKEGINGEFGSLYKEAARALRELKPDYFVAENVEGILSANGGKALAEILSEFRAAGYDVTYKLFNCADLGVPQNRKRVFFYGAQEVLSDLEFHTLFNRVSRVKRRITAGEALADIPAGAANHEKKKHRKETIAAFASLPQGASVKSSGGFARYVRQSGDLPSPTIRAMGKRNGEAPLIHYGEDRYLTNREKARIQSFPDDFVFCGNRAEVATQIGMAVPPIAACEIMKPLFEYAVKKRKKQ
ncbi:MAG: DNA cytosine methyltransferase [Helicobacteraceae bacterium]|jgi:DNA (cytosine-5)-methyltransferase 1|nr:DNA cytosine methyltransferase [Helicobacteraceae bacterium]